MNPRERILLQVIPPPDIKEKDVEESIRKRLKKVGFLRRRLSEIVIYKKLLWMPYYKIVYCYKIENSNPEFFRAETTLNGVFSNILKGSDMISLLFRPNYLAYETKNYYIKSQEMIAHPDEVDVQGILDYLLNRLAKIDEELGGSKHDLDNLRIATARKSLFLPTTRNDLDKEFHLASKTTALLSEKAITLMALNINRRVEAMKLVNRILFYSPTLVAKLRDCSGGSERYIVFELTGYVQDGLIIDASLTRICEVDASCKSALTRSLEIES